MRAGSRRRFRRLERVDAAGAVSAPASPDGEAGESPSAEAGSEAVEPGSGMRFRRALERDGELRLDQSRGPRTHFCQHCEAENSLSVSACFNCGTPLGGPDQAHFDAAKRGEIELNRRAGREREVEQLELEIEQLRCELQLRDAESSRSRRSQILRAKLSLAVIAVCLFATVLAALNLVANIASSDGSPWAAISQAVISALITLAVFIHLQDKIDVL